MYAIVSTHHLWVYIAVCVLAVLAHEFMSMRTSTDESVCTYAWRQLWQAIYTSAPQSSGTLAKVAFAAVVVAVCGTEAVSLTNAQPHSLVPKPYCVCTPDPSFPPLLWKGLGMRLATTLTIASIYAPTWLEDYNLGLWMLWVATRMLMCFKTLAHKDQVHHGQVLQKKLSMSFPNHSGL